MPSADQVRVNRTLEVIVDPVWKFGRGCPVGDGAESELRLPGHPDFAHDHDVEWCAERLGNLETDSNAATRQCFTVSRGDTDITGEATLPSNRVRTAWDGARHR